jgi:DNA-binding LacI/PurR family transcriptional regulator
MAFLKNNLPVDPILDIEVAARDPEVGYQSIDKVLNCPAAPTAVFCENDGLAVGLICACRTRGIDVPRDLSVIGFDDCGLGRSVFPPIRLTTGRIPMELMGKLALEYLINQMDKQDSETEESTPLKIMVPTEFILRETTCSPKT